MKKLFIALAAAALTLPACAQSWWVDGEVSANLSKHGDLRNTSVAVLPEIGYNLGDWDFAAQLGLAYSRQKDTAWDTSVHGASFKFNPFARYTFAWIGNVGFFADLAGQFQTGKFFDPDVAGDEIINGTLWGVGIKPGVKFVVNERLSVNAALGFFGYKRCHDYEFAGLSLNTSNMALGLTYAF